MMTLSSRRRSACSQRIEVNPSGKVIQKEVVRLLAMRPLPPEAVGKKVEHARRDARRRTPLGCLRPPAASFNHLVSEEPQARRNFEPER